VQADKKEQRRKQEKCHCPGNWEMSLDPAL
jgi:hypothetical protein